MVRTGVLAGLLVFGQLVGASAQSAPPPMPPPPGSAPLRDAPPAGGFGPGSEPLPIETERPDPCRSNPIGAECHEQSGRASAEPEPERR
jgi:hypothetical protein